MYEQVYKFEKAGALTGAGTAESRQFTAQCLARGATMLRNMIYTAWIRSADPMPERNRPNTPAPASPAQK